MDAAADSDAARGAAPTQSTAGSEQIVAKGTYAKALIRSCTPAIQTIVCHRPSHTNYANSLPFVRSCLCCFVRPPR